MGMMDKLPSETAPEDGRAVKLDVRGSRVSFPSKKGRFVAVDGIDLAVKEGEFVAIVGPSGSGKSTFLMALDGLVPLSGGTISVEGKEVYGPGPDRAVVFQEACLLPWRTVLDNVAYGLELRGRPKAERHEVARDLIQLSGLAGFEQFYPRQLSGGMRQRVNIARALAADPAVLMLDEPFSGLDAQTRETMQGELLKIWDERKKTAIFVTHQIDEAVYLADRVIAFSKCPARIVAEWEIPFPRPRPLSIKHSDEHRRIENEIWKVLQREGAFAAH
ncbi:ABC transporter ATP-binding protein [Mangrovicoccus sp. HB161399]|uniref:ABC transporter ATP-binding protein n=1 Tax=Mangrovicoccus sp. HB161399 TaxID=2720392 RepID=UPI001C131D3D|nr:ABC transporter ATP-binding protein [Mangrovicoccus sp. HB161399]